MSQRLPRPVTTTELYLAAILDELRGVAEQLAAQQAAGEIGDLLSIREVDPPGTLLPDDFPGRDALHEAGIIYLETVPNDGDALVSIPGIGKATAGKILAALR